MKTESDIPGWKLNEKPCGECKNMKRDMHGSFCPKLLMATHETFKIMYNVSKGTCFEKK